MTADLEPANSGTAWTTTFNAIGSADAKGNVTEFGQSVDSASFGFEPRMDVPGANAHKGTFTSIVTGTLIGTFTEGAQRWANIHSCSRPPVEAVGGPKRHFL
jgi:hypothetical protein